MTKDFSPEERLLRLIRSKTPGPATVSASPMVSGIQKTPQPRAVIPPKVRGKVFRLQTLNWILIAALIASMAYFMPLFFSRPRSTLK